MSLYSPYPLLVNGGWIRDDGGKVETYASHLQATFTPNTTAAAALPEQPSLPPIPLSFSPRQVAAVVDKLNIHKAPGADRISGRVLRELPRFGIIWLTRIYNAVVRLQHFPALWKVAKIIMLLKSGKPPTELQSYRPISLLSVFSKTFEKLLHHRLLQMLPPDALPDHQFGFRAQHATTDQLSRVATTIIQSLESKQFCAAAFLDVAQAFDKVWHDGLLFKLGLLLPSNVCALLRSYLTDRSFFVVYGLHHSTPRPITAGVPQGSVLGPLLYALFTADLPDLSSMDSEASSTVLATFADDTALLAISPDYSKAVADLQVSLDAVMEWTRRWRICINSHKSVNTTFALRPHGHLPVLLDGAIIPYHSTAKYLGVHLDERLSYAHHVRTKRRELDQRLRSLSWLFRRDSGLSLENKRLLYMTVVRPLWTYALPVWGCTSPSNRQIIQRHQNKALRLVAGAPWYVRNDVLHSDLQVPTVLETIQRLATRNENRLHHHPNALALELLDNSSHLRRLQRRHLTDLAVITS